MVNIQDQKLKNRKETNWPTSNKEKEIIAESLGGVLMELISLPK